MPQSTGLAPAESTARAVAVKVFVGNNNLIILSEVWTAEHCLEGGCSGADGDAVPGI